VPETGREMHVQLWFVERGSFYYLGLNWEDNIKMDPEEITSKDTKLISLAQNLDQRMKRVLK
jgi:hypothetical protein